VYTWGAGRKGELGHEPDPSSKQTPRLVEALEGQFVVQVACGGNHTVAITDLGTMYTWGMAKSGQLGHGDTRAQRTPQKVNHPLAKDIVFIACGNQHTIAVNRGGGVVSFGCAKHGQIGHGKDDDSLEPTLIDALASKVVLTASCGANHSMFVTGTLQHLLLLLTYLTAYALLTLVASCL
jgi:alpha-tubulin suppressor-like RCC1 family protein